MDKGDGRNMRIPRPDLIKISAILSFLIAWELIARAGIFSKFLFPSVSDSITWALQNWGRLLRASYDTLRLLLTALAISTCISLSVGSLASISKKFRRISEALVSTFNPLPSISLLPFALLWFGLGEEPILFVTCFGSLWPFILNITNGFTTINKTYLDVGRNYGLKNYKLVSHIMIPAAFPYILTGFRCAWGIAWRSVVAAELVFGAVGISGGLGWIIYANRFKLNAPGMVAAIAAISVIGILTENILLEFLERKTVKKWGMKN